MGASSSTLHPEVFAHARKEYEKNKETFNDEEMMNHLAKEIQSKHAEMSPLNKDEGSNQTAVEVVAEEVKAKDADPADDSVPVAVAQTIEQVAEEALKENISTADLPVVEASFAVSEGKDLLTSQSTPVL
jgi:seryl-tRNA(Sec) selenium transferase